MLLSGQSIPLIGAVQMIKWIKSQFDTFRGTGDAGLSIPSFDGAFKPNSKLDEMTELAQMRGLDNLISFDGDFYCSSNNIVYKLSGGGLVNIHDDVVSNITALACSDTGVIAVARSGGGISFIHPNGKIAPVQGLSNKYGDITSMTFIDGPNLVFTIGAEGRLCSEWRHDFMNRGKSGSVWISDLNGNVKKLAHNLAYPFGVTSDNIGNIIVSVAWDSMVIQIDRNGMVKKILENLPGYPARLIKSEQSGYWLTLFSARNQLVEFVLREKKYRYWMMKQVDCDQWICPSLSRSESPLDVMQSGAQKVGGLLSPWAPTLSYGMLVKLDEYFLPDFSFQSRANGKYHGITSVAENKGQVLVSSHGGSAIIDIKYQ